MTALLAVKNLVNAIGPAVMAGMAIPQDPALATGESS
jgi:hypothetical protein